jgi:hypothetical protein
LIDRQGWLDPVGEQLKKGVSAAGGEAGQKSEECASRNLARTSSASGPHGRAFGRVDCGAGTRCDGGGHWAPEVCARRRCCRSRWSGRSRGRLRSLD